MKHLRLLGMESEREALLKAMQEMECVEISSIDGSEEALKSGFAKPDDKALQIPSPFLLHLFSPHLALYYTLPRLSSKRLQVYKRRGSISSSSAWCQK